MYICVFKIRVAFFVSQQKTKGPQPTEGISPSVVFQATKQGSKGRQFSWFVSAAAETAPGTSSFSFFLACLYVPIGYWVGQTDLPKVLSLPLTWHFTESTCRANHRSCVSGGRAIILTRVFYGWVNRLEQPRVDDPKWLAVRPFGVPIPCIPEPSKGYVGL